MGNRVLVVMRYCDLLLVGVDHDKMIDGEDVAHFQLVEVRSNLQGKRNNGRWNTSCTSMNLNISM